MKRIKSKEFLVVGSDETERLMITSREAYQQMGDKPSKWDKEINSEDLGKMQRTFNGHTAMFMKGIGLGSEHDIDRIRKTENVAPNKLTVNKSDGTCNERDGTPPP